MNSNAAASRHGLIFALLASLVLLSVIVHLMHFPAGLNNLAVLAIAFGMAGLVVGQYMGLKGEGPLVYATFFIPVLLFAILVVLLIPDIAHQPLPFLGGR